MRTIGSVVRLRTTCWGAIRVSTALLAVPAFAQGAADACGPGEIYADCFDTLFDEEAAKLELPRAQVRERLEDATVTSLTNKPASDASPGAASSLRDTLAGFLSDLGLGTINSQEDTLTFNLNLERLKLGEGQKLSLSAILRDPVPYQPLIDELSEDVREARKTSLDQDLDDFDDTEIQGGWSLENQFFGRSYLPHRETISRIFEALIDRASSASEEEEERDEAFLEIFQRLGGSIDFNDETPEDVRRRVASLRSDADSKETEADVLEREGRRQDAEELRQQGENLRRKAADLDQLESELQSAISGAAGSWARARAERIEAIRASEIVRLADLVNNQPQLRVEGFFRNRDDLAGPDSYGAELNLEWGPANFNGFRDFCGRGAADLECFGRFLNERRAFLLERAPRGSVKIKWARTDPYRVSLDEDGIELDREENEETVASAAIGLYVRSNDAGQQVARLDLEASHCDVDDDPDRQDRTVATLTFLQRVSEHTDASVSLVWASKPEFRGEVDDELSARAGFKLSFDRKQDDG